MFLTCWNRSCHCIAWERGRLARVPGTRASCPTWERGRLARMPGTRASCLAWERGRLARMPGSAGILPHLGARASRPHARDAGIPPRLGARASCPPGSAGILPRLGSRASRPHWERGHLALDAPRGRDVLALQGQVLGRRLRSLSRFGLQDAQTPPSSLVGEGGWGDEGQKRTGMQQTAHRFQERSP
jgi:hypothetical protein